MYLVAGLGNPGPKHSKQRHNVGFMVVEHLREQYLGGPFKDKFKGRFCKVLIGREDVVLLQPQTFMNLSGESVGAAMSFFKLDRSRLVAVYDELDLPYQSVRIKQSGGTAGHNGMKSLVSHCGGPDFARVRVGIGRPRSGAVTGHVLGDFSQLEGAELPDVLVRASAAISDIVQLGVTEAMNRHNRGESSAG